MFHIDEKLSELVPYKAGAPPSLVRCLFRKDKSVRPPGQSRQYLAQDDSPRPSSLAPSVEGVKTVSHIDEKLSELVHYKAGAPPSLARCLFRKDKSVRPLGQSGQYLARGRLSISRGPVPRSRSNLTASCSLQIFTTTVWRRLWKPLAVRNKHNSPNLGGFCCGKNKEGAKAVSYIDEKLSELVPHKAGAPPSLARCLFWKDKSVRPPGQSGQYLARGDSPRPSS
ncbi:hypothetical protein Acr_15g0008010 [Actinidia rufa]|uniref:Uncharacterized protein n=1 Tax=Actinidia rufa TaxID=165716 RepID=A0A7J0FU18_9ERIC|nr:hypothetical protein Acr_15g0008010 [Actinidia rufa]